MGENEDINITVTDRRGREQETYSVSDSPKESEDFQTDGDNDRSARLDQIVTEMGNNIFGQNIRKLEGLGDDSITHEDRIKMKDDPQVRYGSLVKKFALLGQGWSVDRGNGLKKYRDFVERVFSREVGNSPEIVESSFVEKLRQMLSATDHGVSLTEKVWAENNDNEIVLRDLKTREMELNTFRVTKDTHGNIKKLEQQSAGTTEIPLEKVIIFPYFNEGDKITGRSDLESAWDAWFRKKTIKEFYSAYLELRSKINTYASLDGRELNSGLAEEIWKMLKNLQLGGRMIVPDGVDLKTLDMGQANENLFFKALKYWDGQILKALLTPHLVAEASTEQSNTGSFALGQTHFSVFLLIVRYLKKKLQDKINEEIVRPLIDFNFANVDNYPIFKINAFQTEKHEDLANTVALLTNAGVINGDEDWIDDFVGLPTDESTKRAMLNTEGMDGVENLHESLKQTDNERMNYEQGIDFDEDNFSAPCRKSDESKDDCTSRKIPELIEDEGMDRDQAVAVANDMCSKSCDEMDMNEEEIIEAIADESAEKIHEKIQENNENLNEKYKNFNEKLKDKVDLKMNEKQFELIKKRESLLDDLNAD